MNHSESGNSSSKLAGQFLWRTNATDSSEEWLANESETNQMARVRQVRTIQPAVAEDLWYCIGFGLKAGDGGLYGLDDLVWV